MQISVLNVMLNQFCFMMSKEGSTIVRQKMRVVVGTNIYIMFFAMKLDSYNR